MSTVYTKTNTGKYIEVSYSPDIQNLSFKHVYNSKQLCSSEEDADNLIYKLKELEASISLELVNRNLPFKAQLIILTYLNVIDSICSGLDIRSKLSNEELTDIFIRGYQKKYDEALAFCNKTIALYENGGKNESYTKHWRDYDKHNELVEEFQFELKKFGDSDFYINLEKLKKGAENLLELLMKENSK
jgi:hypothetical protein